MRLLRRAARLATITTLLGATAALVAVTSPAASAAPAAGPDGWVRIAHLSPQAPAMDMYMYPFGISGRPLVLKDVSYGAVSAYMALSPGQYTVAMRGGLNACAAGSPCARLRPSERPMAPSPMGGPGRRDARTPASSAPASTTRPGQFRRRDSGLVNQRFGSGGAV